MLYEYLCTVKKVGDGDNVYVDIDLGYSSFLHNQSIRLYGLDAPETRTRDRAQKAHALLAKACVEDHLKVGETYKLRTIKKGKFGRYLGIIKLKGKRGTINDLLLESLLAVPYHGENKKVIKAAHEKNRQELMKQGLL